MRCAKDTRHLHLPWGSLTPQHPEVIPADFGATLGPTERSAVLSVFTFERNECLVKGGWAWQAGQAGHDRDSALADWEAGVCDGHFPGEEQRLQEPEEPAAEWSQAVTQAALSHRAPLSDIPRKRTRSLPFPHFECPEGYFVSSKWTLF